jgi:acetoin utilization deacetylase AcuC-like enzyme
MTELAVYYDEIFLEHEAPGGKFVLPADELLGVDDPHPDTPDRIRNIRHVVDRQLDDVTTWEAVTPATREELRRVHDPGYLDDLEAACAGGGERLTPTTGVSERTCEAARHAAGAAILTAERALDGGVDEVAYAPVRPSGHHAQPGQADGFCYLNNVAVAAAAARTAGAADRVAVVDWDVHHGNGTQECFYDRDDVLIVSLHNDFGVWGPQHPQTGGIEERGEGEGDGYSVNVPLPPGTGDEGYAYAFETVVEPVVAAFDPDLLLVSAGQDPGHLDPMARNLVTKAGFEDLGRRVRALAAEHADGHLGIVQEGGYQQSHLPYATLGVLEGALGIESDVDEPFFRLEEYTPPAREWVDEAASAHAERWSLE